MLKDFSLRSKFIPYSQSRNKGTFLSLNWEVTLLYRDREILTTEYSAGVAHCPSYKFGDFTKFTQDKILWECEHGRRCVYGEYTDRFSGREKLEPRLQDFLFCILSDYSVLDYPDFPSWAESLGYSDDSILAKQIYDNCLKVSLQLRGNLGEDKIKELEELL